MVDMGFNGMFLDPHCRSTVPAGGHRIYIYIYPSLLCCQKGCVVVEY